MFKFADQEREKIYKKALAEVNRLRKERKIGKSLVKLPKGKWGNGQHCPIQKALRCWKVDEISIFWGGDPLDDTYTPENIGNFIIAFDDHQFPEMEE